MPGYVYFILGLAWAVWLAPFIFRSKRPGKAQEVKVRARWGIVLVAVAFSVLWQGKFWERETPLWKLVLASSFFAAGWALSWTAVHALGRQWRIDAGLNPDHHLVRSGPYALVRHPIYTSMLCVLIGTGLIVTPWPLFVCALVLFIIGTEIRVRTEEALLASRFGEEFAKYRRRVPAYIPGLQFIRHERI